MQFKLSLLTGSLLAALTLTGCGGSDSDTPAPTPKETVTIKAIDGYLENAEVCIDKNDNAVCDNGETFKTQTNAKGEVTIDIADAKHNIIITAKGGHTSDSDRSGFLANDYQYIIKANSEVTANSIIAVTPFTTLAYKNNKTIEEIATDLNIQATVISGDYVAEKQGDNKEEATKAHALARSITTTLPPRIDTINTSELNKSVKAINDKITELENTNTDLDSITIEISDNGTAESTTTYTLSKYFAFSEEVSPHNTRMQMISLNKAYADEEGLSYVYVTKANEIQIAQLNNQNESSTHQFKIEGNDLITSENGTEKSKDTFIYLSHDVSLAVPKNDGDLILWTKGDLESPQAINKETFVDKTLYFISDDSTNTNAEPIIAEMTFAKDKVTIIETGNEDMIRPWSIDDNGNLFIDFPDGDKDMNFKVITKDRNIMVTEDQNHKNMFGMFLSNENMATILMQKWAAIKK